MGLPWGGTHCSGACGQSLSGTRVFKNGWERMPVSYPNNSVLTNVIILA